MATSDNLLNYSDDTRDAALLVWSAFGLPLIEDLPNPIATEQLLDTQTSEIIQKLVYEAIRTNSNRDAIELIHRLRLAENLKSADQQAHNLYHNFIILLKFISFISRKQKDARILLNEGLVQAMRAGVDVVNNIHDYFALYEGETGTDKQMRRELAYSLENNKEHIGDQPIMLEQQGSAVPTLQNWLKNYNQVQPLVNERTKFNQINYLNTSLNARKLPSGEKRILAEILGLYDSLLFPPTLKFDYNRLNAEVQALNAGQYLTTEKFILPKSEAEKLYEQPVQAQPAPKQDIQASAIDREPPSIQPPLTILQKPAPSANPATLPPKPVNIQDILGKKPGSGISFAGGNINAEALKKQFEEKQQAQNKEIDRKLEDLRRKTNNLN